MKETGVKFSAFRPGEVRFRATFAAGELDASQRFGQIDEEAGVLHGVQINIMGEAKGHGVFLGEDFIDGVVAQGNASKLGIKSRFGHPAMCSDALGTFLGRAKNFAKKEVKRSDGTTCWGAFADFHLAQEAKHSPGGDLYTWTMMTAKNSPDTFGQSIVFTYADWYVLDKDGGKLLWTAQEGYDSEDYDLRRKAFDRWMEQSVDGKIYAVLGELLGTDFTDTPAATDGVFGAGSLASQATALIDENPQIFALLTSRPDTVAQFLERYNATLTAAGKPAVCLSVAGGPDASSLAARLEEAEKRFSGMQSAKDREIAELKNAAQSAKTDFDFQLSKLRNDLEAAQAALSVANEAKGKAEAALAATGEQLKAKINALAKLNGGVLVPEGAGSFASWSDAVAALGYAKAKREHPELYAAVMATAKQKKD